jgi:quercetin dioxygenase-like cupin family protein
MRLCIVPLAAVCLGPSIAPAQPTTVPITNEPSHHFALANAYVRVFDVTAAPHATTLVHRHDHDYLFVTLGDADITSTPVGAPARHLVLADGAVEYAPGGFAHAVRDNLDRPFHNITIELLHPATDVHACGARCPSLRACAPHHGCVTERRVIRADQWSVRSVELSPGADWIVNAAAGPALIVAVSDADLTVHGPHESTTGAHRRPGSLIWVPPTRHAGPEAHALIRNAGASAARLVVLELQTAAFGHGPTAPRTPAATPPRTAG